MQTREAWIDLQDKEFNQFLILLYVLLALSVVVSVFGMINTLVLTVFERTRELGHAARRRHDAAAGAPHGAA